MDYKELVEKILLGKDAKQGLHINVIASRIHEATSGLMFPDEDHPQLSYDEIVKRISSILATDVKKIAKHLS